MVRLAGELLEAPVVHPASDRRSWRNFVELALTRQKAGRDKPGLLVIAPSPRDLYLLTQVDDWHRGFSQIAAWVIDSFWTERLVTIGLKRSYGHLFIAGGNDVDEYMHRTRIPTSFLGWGTDALRLGSGDAARDVDVLRVGRQPDAWDDDAVLEQAFAAQGLRFQGRPPLPQQGEDPQELVCNHYRRAKFLIAFSNLVAPKAYTHPTKEYATGRWTDGLGAGCVVAGVSPATDHLVRACFWPGALCELDSSELAPGIAQIAQAVGAWQPEQARINHLEALARLDWRWRFREIAEHFGLSAPRLDRELAQIQARVSGARA
ncbi:MAG: hypothetical protein ACFBRM_16050 [Pikeienuella sp.]